MLLVCHKGREEEVKEIFSRWDLDAVVIGEVKDHGKLVVYDRGVKVAEIANCALTDEAPAYSRPTRSLVIWKVRETGGTENSRNLKITTPCCWVWPDRLSCAVDAGCTVSTTMTFEPTPVAGPGSDAAVLRLKEGTAAAWP